MGNLERECEVYYIYILSLRKYILDIKINVLSV